MTRAARAAGVLLLAGLACLARGSYIPAKAVVAQALLRRAWQRTGEHGGPVRPWPWAKTWPVARLRAPDGISFIVLAGAQGAALAFGPGHVDGTPLPGRGGNTVIAGHRDTQFRFLQGLRLGDELVLETADGASHRFAVVDSRVVLETDLSVLDGGGESELTLLTCYPFDAVLPGGPLRYVVRARGVGETASPTIPTTRSPSSPSTPRSPSPRRDRSPSPARRPPVPCTSSSTSTAASSRARFSLAGPGPAGAGWG